jgi:hypothetical protein
MPQLLFVKENRKKSAAGITSGRLLPIINRDV